MRAARDVKRIRVPRKPAGQFHHGNLAEAALAVATEEIDRHGHLVLSLRAVAERLGVSQPALYRHFASKDALLDEIGLRGFARFVEVMAPPSPTGDAFAQLAQLGRNYIRFAHANQGWFRLWFSRVNNERAHAPEHRAFVERMMPLGMRARASLRGVIVDIVGEDAPIVDDLYRVVWALTHGLAVFIVDRVFQLVQTDDERIAAADAAIAVHVDAMRARFSRSSAARR
jgi:AcrR family transcriptional regulator